VKTEDVKAVAVQLVNGIRVVHPGANSWTVKHTGGLEVTTVERTNGRCERYLVAEFAPGAWLAVAHEGEKA